MNKKTYEVKVLKNVDKHLKKQQKYIYNKFLEWIEELKQNPYDNNEGLFKGNKYLGLPVYKKRFGSFRVLFVVDDETITVIIFKTNSRGQIYKKNK